MEARDHHYVSRTDCACDTSVRQHGQAACEVAGMYHADRRLALFGVHRFDPVDLLALSQERNDRSPKNVKDFECF